MTLVDRYEAGIRLGDRLSGLEAAGTVIIGLARSGVPVAQGVSERLGAPLDVMLVRRLQARGRPDVEVGVASASVLELDDGTLDTLEMPESWVRSAVVEEMADLRRRERVYRHGRTPVDLRGRLVVLVDDLLSDVDRIQVAIRSLRRRSPLRVILAAPVVSPVVRSNLLGSTDGIVALAVCSSSCQGCGRREPLTDAEVMAILR